MAARDGPVPLLEPQLRGQNVEGRKCNSLAIDLGLPWVCPQVYMC